MEEFKIPTDVQDELVKLRKREKLLSWIVAGFMVVVLFFGAKVYFANNALAQYEGYGGYSQGLSSGGGGCGGGGCGSQGQITGPLLSNEELQVQALGLYKQETGQTDVKAEVSDYGCHIQIDILDSQGSIIRSYGYRGGNEIYLIR